MARAELIHENELERIYKVIGNTHVILKLEDDFSEIKFYNIKREKLDGEFNFIDETENYKNYLLARMYVPLQFKNLGLGRAALEFFTEYTGSSIYTRPNDGIVRNDGSHLTEEAPGFVSKMINEGLITDSFNHDGCEY